MEAGGERGGDGNQEGSEQQGDGGAETVVLQWTPMFTRGTFYYEYTSSYVINRRWCYNY